MKLGVGQVEAYMEGGDEILRLWKRLKVELRSLGGLQGGP